MILDVLPATAARLATPGPLVLREAEGRAVAVMPEATPWQDPAGWRVGGRVVGLQPPPAYDHVDLRVTPAALGQELARRGWRRAVAVPVDRALHRADITSLARLAEADATGIVVFATHTAAHPPDAALYARVRALRRAVAHLPAGRAVLVYDERPEAEGGPGSPADVTLARAYGCDRLATWGPPSIALAAAAREARLEVVTLAAGPAAPRDESPAALEAWTWPDIAAELARGDQAGTSPGVTIFFTGLSGSGKSTVANALRVRLLEDGCRTVTLLDGDLVRQHLSSELGFSREHRNLNVRRIAFVAAEITRHGGLAICAPIAPYAELRREARALVERVGTFLLVYVATPLEVCEARDPKGLYQRARAGTLPEFTGVSDPYEAPDDADLTIDTSRLAVAQAVDLVIAALEGRRLLRPRIGSPPPAPDGDRIGVRA